MNAPHADRSEAFREGHRAAWLYDAYQQDNPHRYGSREGAEWGRGWWCAMAEQPMSFPSPYQPTTTC